MLLPILDYLIPVDHTNLANEGKIRKFEKDKRFLIPVYMVVLMDFGLYASLLYRVSTGNISNKTDLIVYAICAAQIGMVNATAGHELFHRRERVHKIFGTLPYSKMLYAHFFV